LGFFGYGGGFYPDPGARKEGNTRKIFRFVKKNF
jgi:hypothetical protein